MWRLFVVIFSQLFCATKFTTRTSTWAASILRTHSLHTTSTNNTRPSHTEIRRRFFGSMTAMTQSYHETPPIRNECASPDPRRLVKNDTPSEKSKQNLFWLVNLSMWFYMMRVAWCSHNLVCVLVYWSDIILSYKKLPSETLFNNIKLSEKILF